MSGSARRKSTASRAPQDHDLPGRCPLLPENRSKYSLKEHRNSHGEHDCIFLKEEKVASGKDGEQIIFTKRSCTIYQFRPLQCRTWPFWKATLPVRRTGRCLPVAVTA